MEVISCELLEEGGDFCVVGIDYFMEGLLGEGISLIVNVKYDFLIVCFEMYENVCINGFLIFGWFLECIKYIFFMWWYFVKIEDFL